MAVSRILSWMIIHLIPRSRDSRRISIRRGATYPRIFVGPAALPLFCLAPHGVFRAVALTRDAVSSYLAFSPLPALRKNNCSQRTGGVFSVTLSVNARFRERRPRILRGMLPYGVRTFLQRIPPRRRLTSDHLPSAGILAHSGLNGSGSFPRRFQPGPDVSRPRTIEDAMATSFYCRRGIRTSNHASRDQSPGCRSSATFALVCRRVR